jgi:hypothetical protein
MVLVELLVGVGGKGAKRRNRELDGSILVGVGIFIDSVDFLLSLWSKCFTRRSSAMFSTPFCEMSS